MVFVRHRWLASSWTGSMQMIETPFVRILLLFPALDRRVLRFGDSRRIHKLHEKVVPSVFL